ncbi:MAG TPA: putative porin, partial [Rhodothermales bacterium]
GFYLDADATTMRITGDGPIASRLEGSLPKLFGSARGGMRYRMFRGDLDLHLYVQVRAWSAFRSRTLHTPTGLLILPEEGADELDPSSTIGVYVEAGVREATIFIAWENLAAGTPLMEGNMTVPVYPLPEQALRFGVFWPIWD